MSNLDLASIVVGQKLGITKLSQGRRANYFCFAKVTKVTKTTITVEEIKANPLEGEALLSLIFNLTNGKERGSKGDWYYWSLCSEADVKNAIKARAANRSREAKAAKRIAFLETLMGLARNHQEKSFEDTLCELIAFEHNEAEKQA